MEQKTKTTRELAPSIFMENPMGSIFQKSESETVARNIMTILKRTGDVFRIIRWDEYKEERKQVGFNGLQPRT